MTTYGGGGKRGLARPAISRQSKGMLTTPPRHWTLDYISNLRETDEVEAKLAAGRDGRGELPKDFWPTYSAFANSSGGYIVLGVRERAGHFSVEGGIIDTDKVRGQIFDQACNPQKVSVNLLRNEDVDVISISERNLIVVRVMQATRRHKPVFIDGNPMKGTYRRFHEGDHLCDAETVKRMLGEQTEDSRDDRVLKGFGIADLNLESVEVYRRMMRDASPQHPFLEQPLAQFLRSIRAWRVDRESEQEGLTVAGLLMFGTSESIRDEFPNFTVDYQERDEPKISRYVDRITNDGTWSGNIFDFYRLVWRKISSGLKAPFHLHNGQRIDQTSAHVALREALVNALVHADYTGRASVLVVQRPDMFGFRNPGGMRVPVELAVRGGESDGRNRTLQQMFLMIGAGERAGSGVPKIHMGWREQHWRAPSLYELQQPSDQTILELRMEDLLPSGVVHRLQQQFGERFNALSPEERVVVATAAVEATVSHTRAMTLCDIHSVDMTKLLQGLVQAGLLDKVGQGRGTKYHLFGAQFADPDDAFVGPAMVQADQHRGQPSESPSEPSELEPEPSELAPQGSEGSQANSRGRTVDGLDLTLIDALDGLDADLAAGLEDAASVATKKRPAKAEMEAAVIALCTGHYLTLKVLARLLHRSEDYLRMEYMNPLAQRGLLRLAFPQAPSHPRQAYSAAL